MEKPPSKGILAYSHSCTVLRRKFRQRCDDFKDGENNSRLVSFYCHFYSFLDRDVMILKTEKTVLVSSRLASLHCHSDLSLGKSR